ncbi:MAG: undecaprenyl/decaprenyl-phosphate alpha-N-acetylglucosaminyl 1-phosphate transferase [Phycisphaeraceae bacterium]|nr:undecaprenyl/decaprenyl-phosphate alpha-N-acetylglucosaminyl 1-phosphate transferase [Phycisphaeraceae bacterium]MCW5754393.1 undecaprenyl/decaprenyl-phosphate alpha-N-acetylglucosaminyl 1-phosphate transferase [Phycisphaeraceae bacterium]
MIEAILLLIPIAFAVSLTGVWIMLRLGRRLRAFDSAPIPGQQKMRRRPIPNTGGVGLFLGIALPVLAGLVALNAFADPIVRAFPALAEHLPRIREQTFDAVILLLALTALHIIGVIDDRRPLGPGLKLAIMLGCAAAVVTATTGTRLLTMLDAHVGGPWLSILITILWFGVVTNAMNFMDNMDGLSAGCAAVASICFLIATLLNAQWLVAALLALLIGASLGFLVFNFPPAKIFMGDGGSLILGFLLAFLTTRTTFYDPAVSAGWYALCMPLLVLAVPLYDFVTVSCIRIRAGKSPFVGDLNHFSHRLRRRGLSTRQVALVVYGLTAATGVSGIILASLNSWQAALVSAQVALILAALALIEFASRDQEHPVEP